MTDRAPYGPPGQADRRRGLTHIAAAALSCGLLALALFLHCWVRTRATEQGYRLSQLAAEGQKLEREHARLLTLAAQLKSPQRIGELARAQLGMGPPSSEREVIIALGVVRGGAPVVASAP